MTNTVFKKTYNCATQQAGFVGTSAALVMVQDSPAQIANAMVMIYPDNADAGFFFTPADAREFAEQILSAVNALEVPVVAREPETKTKLVRKPRNYSALSPQCQTLLQHCRRAGSITARDAMNDYGITSATLVRRFCDLEEAGWGVVRSRRVHPITGKRYTRYSVVE